MKATILMGYRLEEDRPASVEHVDEDDGGRLLTRLLEQVTHARHGLSEQRLADVGRPTKSTRSVLDS